MTTATRCRLLTAQALVALERAGREEANKTWAHLQDDLEEAARQGRSSLDVATPNKAANALVVLLTGRGFTVDAMQVTGSETILRVAWPSV